MADQNVVDWVPDESLPQPPISTVEWDGTRTRLRVARNVWRGDRDPQGRALQPRLVGREETIEFEAKFDRRTRTWSGPEAEHVQHLIDLGAIAGTARAAEMDAMIRNVEVERGAWGGGENGAPLRPDLRQRTRDDLYDLMRRAGGIAYVSGTFEERRRIDRQEARRSDQSDAVRDLADAIRESASRGGEFNISEFIENLSDSQVRALAEAIGGRAGAPMDNTGEWPGAQAPGTHVSARARRNRQEEAEPPPLEE